MSAKGRNICSNKWDDQLVMVLRYDARRKLAYCHSFKSGGARRYLDEVLLPHSTNIVRLKQLQADCTGIVPTTSKDHRSILHAILIDPAVACRHLRTRL